MSIGPKPNGGSNGNNATDGAKGQPMNKNKGGNGKGNGKGKGNGGGGLRYGAYGGYKGASRKLANQFVGADIRRLRRDTKSNVRQERRTFQREHGDIKHVYQQSAQNMRHLKQNTNQSYNQTINAAQAAQQALSAHLAAQSGAAQGGANSELARLGLGGTDATSQMAADAQYSQQTAGQNSADNLANLNMAKSNANSMSNMMLASNRGQRMSDTGQARNIRDENISQLRDALHSAQAGRGDSVRALLDQMAQTGWAQHMGQAQLNLQRQAINKTGSVPYGLSNSYSSGGYSASSYQPTYGYGYSSPSGYSPSSGGSSYGGAANAAKQNLYSSLLNMNP